MRCFSTSGLFLLSIISEKIIVAGHYFHHDESKIGIEEIIAMIKGD